MRTALTVLVCVSALSVSPLAHQKPQAGPAAEKAPAASAAPAEPSKALIPLKVQIVLSRFRGEKKISSLPYILGVTANEGEKTSLRMGIDVPVSNKSQGYVYRSVGTNIDCDARASAGDEFRLNLQVQDSSIHLDPSRPADSSSAPGIVSDIPVFRTFNSSFVVLLRDGQTVQHTSAVDPISGEVMKIDVTLNVIK